MLLNLLYRRRVTVPEQRQAECWKLKTDLATVSRKSRNLSDVFRMREFSLFLQKDGASRPAWGTKLCSYLNFCYFNNIRKEKLYRVSGSDCSSIDNLPFQDLALCFWRPQTLQFTTTPLTLQCIKMCLRFGMFLNGILYSGLRSLLWIPFPAIVFTTWEHPQNRGLLEHLSQRFTNSWRKAFANTKDSWQRRACNLLSYVSLEQLGFHFFINGSPPAVS